jgi:hypothetical protein
MITTPVRKQTLLAVLLIPWLLPAASYATRVALHIYPDAKSPVMQHFEIQPGQFAEFPRVVDASLKDPWYWTTIEGEFTGYVGRNDLDNRGRLREGTLIRVDPTQSGWVLTKYQDGDQVRIRSRMSVVRVTVKKEIPVYFMEPAASIEHTPGMVSPTEAPLAVVSPPKTAVQKPVTVEPEEPQATAPTPAEAQDASEAPTPPAPPPVADRATAAPVVPTGDPLLEEKPRVPMQELADLASIPAEFEREFEGFLRMVPSSDPQSSRFRFQLETRSGRRIVYLDSSQLRGITPAEWLDSWINVRGSLEETTPDFHLFVMARSLWADLKE